MSLYSACIYVHVQKCGVKGGKGELWKLLQGFGQTEKG